MKKRSLYSAAEYIRLSREDGDKAESDSIGNQRKLITGFLKDKEDFVLYDTYVDDGYTGTNFRRPSFQRMIADIEDGKVNCVIVKDLSRFGRDYIDTGKYLERYFPDHEVRFISITDHIDSMKQTYDMLLPIKNIFNEQYARDISQKVHSSMKTKQKAGEFIGAFASYGYRKSPADKNRLVVDEYAAEIVRRIFRMYLNGQGKNSIAAALNREGIVCPSEYKKMNGENYRNSQRLETTSYWTYSTIHHLLQNEMYAGNMVQGKKTQRMRGRQHAVDREDWIIVKNTHEAIIDAATWEKTQNLLKRRTRTPALHTDHTVFAGFLKCGDCGRALVKKTGSRGHGKEIVHYYCGTYVRSGRQYCTPHAVPHAVLEKIISEDIQTILEQMGDLRPLVEQSRTAAASKRETGRETDRISAELEKIRKWKKAVYEDYREELVSREEFLSYRQDYEKKEKLLAGQLACLEERRSTENNFDPYEEPFIKRLVERKSIERLDRELLAEMIQEIKVYENRRIKIVYNFSEHGLPQ